MIDLSFIDNYDYTNLPIWFQNDIKIYRENYIKMLNKESHVFDCIIEQIRSDINVCEVENIIDKKYANLLRERFL